MSNVSDIGPVLIIYCLRCGMFSAVITSSLLTGFSLSYLNLGVGFFKVGYSNLTACFQIYCQKFSL